MGDKPTRYRLKLKRLDFISAVDAGAQGPIANVALIKRADSNGFEATFRVAKTDESLGLVFGWAMAGSLDGGKTPHVDLQDDAIDVNSDEFLKACAEFMEGGAAADVMHDGEQDGRVVFAFPLIPEINKALGIESSTHGLAIAMKPSAETFKRFQRGELAAFSIGGIGERVPLDKARQAHEMTMTIEPSDELRALIRLGADQMSDLAKREVAMSARIGEQLSRLSSEMTALIANKNNGSSRPAGEPKVVSKMNELDELKAQITALTAKVTSLEEQLGAAKAEAELTDEEKAHAAKLDDEEQKRFKALSKSDRKAEVMKALEADPVVCTFEGVSYRKSNPMAPLAKRLAEQAEAIEKADIEKQAGAYLGGMPGTADVHFAIAKAVLSISDLAVRKAALEALGGASAIVKGRANAPGFDGAHADPAGANANPYERLAKGLETFCKANSIDLSTKWTVGLAKFTSTDEGAALKRAYDESRS